MKNKNGTLVLFNDAIEFRKYLSGESDLLVYFKTKKGKVEIPFPVFVPEQKELDRNVRSILYENLRDLYMD